MASLPDEDGFHSIAWDDAPSSRPGLTDVSSPLNEDDDNGFETISPPPETPPPVESIASTSTARIPRMGSGDTDIDPKEWGGRWMNIEVKDPVKEHEGSKDMFVSYAVRTKVGVRAR